MNATWHIENLNDLFFVLFKADEQRAPIIKGFRRLNREDYFTLFFPDALCEEYLSKTKSNLTWFFNNDSKNKGIKHSLMNAIRKNSRQVVDEVHKKCMDVLWPRGQHPSFDREPLYEALSRVRIRPALNAQLHIVAFSPADTTPSRLQAFFDADPSAALARMLLTLSVQPDGDKEMLSWIWNVEHQDMSQSFLAQENGPDGQMRYGRLLYLDGDHAKAYSVFESVTKQLNRSAETIEESAMYCQMARMLLTGDGHYTDRDLAVSYMQKSLLDENPESYYLLSQNLEGAEALALLEKAASLNWGPALRELGNAWFGGNQRLNCAKNMDNARRYFRQALSLESADGAYCAYMLGRIYEIYQDMDSAINSFKLARHKGSAEAAEKLAGMNWTDPYSAEDENEESPEESHPLHYALMNEFSGDNKAFVSGLRGPWRWIVCTAQDPYNPLSPGVERIFEPRRDIAAVLKDLADDLFAPEKAEFPKLTIALLSEKKQENLYQCISVLRVLEKHAARLKDRRWELVDAVSIYVEAEHDYASLMLDAAFENMRGLYFRVRLCDPTQDSADQLFSAAPLFLPCLQQPDVRNIRLVILGTSDLAMAIVRRAISLPIYGDHELSISVFGEGAENMHRRLLAQCPGIVTAAPTVFRTVPRFFECDLNNGGPDALIQSYRERQGEPDVSHPDADALCQGNYYVIATDDDETNICIGASLRGALLKLTPSFTNFPFIAAHVRNSMASWLAENITPTAQAGQGNPFGQYNLHCFGAAMLYTPDRLENDIIERRAQAVHLQYAGTEEGRHRAMAPYFRRQYNRDSSRATAQYMIYHLFMAGIMLPNRQMYGSPEQEAMLAKPYAEWLCDDDHLEAAAQAEHVRWNCFMLSTGWEQATPTQVAAYVQSGNPGMQLHLSKLHPFLCDWQGLKSGTLIAEVEEAVHSRMPEKRVYGPQKADVDMVKNIAVNLAAGLNPHGEI